MAAPKKTALPEAKQPELGRLTTRSVLTLADQIDCLQFLHSLLKKQMGAMGKDATPCIKCLDYEQTHRGLYPYQIAYLLWYGPVEADKEISHKKKKEISHKCCHAKRKGPPKGKNEPRRISPCINPLHLESATRAQNAGRDDHQIALVKYRNSKRKAMSNAGFSGPIFVTDWNESTKTFTPGYKSSLKSVCQHLVVGDGCFINIGELVPYQKGLVFFEAREELQLLVDKVNAMFKKNQK